MKPKSKSKNIVEEILIKYDVSVRGLAKLLGINPSSITHWKNARNKISPTNLEKIQALDKKLEEMIETKKFTKKEAVESLLNYKNSSLNKNGNDRAGFKKIVDNKVLEYFETIEHLKLEKGYTPDDLLGFQFLFTDKEKKSIVVGYAVDPVTKNAIDISLLGEFLLIKNDLRKKLGEDFLLIIIATEYTDKFLKACEEIPKIKLKTFEMIMK